MHDLCDRRCKWPRETNQFGFPTSCFFFIFCVKFLQLKLRFASCKNNYFTIKGQWLWINNNYDLIICQLTNHQSLLSPTSHQINHYKLLNKVDLLHYPIASIQRNTLLVLSKYSKGSFLTFHFELKLVLEENPGPL